MASGQPMDPGGLHLGLLVRRLWALWSPSTVSRDTRMTTRELGVYWEASLTHSSP